MTQSIEKEFAAALDAAPPLPETLYPAIERKIRKRAALVRAIISVAAILVLAAGLTGYQVSSHIRTTAAVSEELDFIGTYLNGGDVSDEVEEYVMVDVDNY